MAHSSVLHQHNTLAEELSACLDAFAMDTANKEHIRQTVNEYVALCKQRGDPVEQVNASLKDIIRLAVPRSTIYAEHADEEVYARIVRWCIRLHYL